MSAIAAARRPLRETDGRLEQRLHALGHANRARTGRAALKRELRAGRLNLRDLATRRPAPLQEVPLFALLVELPGIGHRRLERLNRRAIDARVNLARTLGDASTATMLWLERELDGTASDRDTGIGTPSRADGWRALALTLDQLIREHEHSVRDESLPAERAWADERLHEARARLMSTAPAGVSS